MPHPLDRDAFLTASLASLTAAGPNVFGQGFTGVWKVVRNLYQYNWPAKFDPIKISNAKILTVYIFV